MSEQEIKPCPFCGSADVRVQMGQNPISVVCWECGALGPTSLNNHVELWNAAPRAAEKGSGE